MDYYPQGLRYLLNQVTQRYPVVNIYVTDVSMVTEENSVQDKQRVEWIRDLANEVLKGVCKAFELSFGTSSDMLWYMILEKECTNLIQRKCQNKMAFFEFDTAWA